MPLRRPWIKFRLRTLLVVVAAIAVWLGWEVNRAQQKRDAFSALCGDGPYAPLAVKHITPESGFAWMRSRVGNRMRQYPCDPIELDLFCAHMDDEALTHLKPFDQLLSLSLTRSRNIRFLPRLDSLRSLQLSDSPTSDEEMKYVVRCRNLDALSLSGARITNTGLEPLTELRHLKELNLFNCSALTPSCVRHFERFPKLNSLSVSGENITNAWLHELSSLNLEVIMIGGGNVTDDAVESLATMKSLKMVDFHGTQVTQVEASRVQQMMIGCTIRVN